MLEAIERLLSDGLVVKTIGLISDKDPSLALLVQARSAPKAPFEAFVSLSRFLSAKPLSVYVDNLYSQIFFNRTDDQQSSIDKEYFKFFTSRGCTVNFSKDVFADRDPPIFARLLDYASRVTAGELTGCLPIEKRENFSTLKLDETIHLLLELLLMEEAKKHNDAIIIGQCSQAIIAAHRNVADKPMSGIVLPRFLNAGDVEKYIDRIRKI